MTHGAEGSGPLPVGSLRMGLATASGCWEVDEDAAATLDALRSRSVHASPLVWDDPEVDWSTWDLVVVRSTWDYVERLDEFLRWTRTVSAATTLANEPAVIEWNTDKRYLEDLASAGVPVVPTRFIAAGTSPDEVSLAQALSADLDSWSTDGFGEVVVKPTVSAGARDTLRLHLDDARVVGHAASLLSAGRDVMVQPYLDRVDEEGETGIVHFAGVRSHAFRKDPLLDPGGAAVEGLFAPERITPRDATPEQVAVADAALSAVERRFGRTLYARVDLVPGADGPVLLELELCEPSFFLGVDSAAPDRFAAAAVDAALSSARRRRR